MEYNVKFIIQKFALFYIICLIFFEKFPLKSFTDIIQIITLQWLIFSFCIIFYSNFLKNS